MMGTVVDWLKISSVALSGMGAYFWIRRNVWSPISWLADMVASKYRYNETAVQELCGQKADSLVAWAYVFLATIAQASLFFIPQTWDSFAPFSIRHIVFLIIFGIVLLIIGNFISRRQEKIMISKVKALLDSRTSKGNTA